MRISLGLFGSTRCADLGPRNFDGDSNQTQQRCSMNNNVIDHMVRMIALVVIVGCVRPDGMETAPVRGMVTLGGKPYTQGGYVVFRPESPGKMATAVIQSDGSFELSTYARGDGAIIGKHKVIVSPPIPDIKDDEADVPITSPIPKKLRSPTTSDLVCDVKADITNDFPILLEGK
jgi:hypothetical protein